MLTVAAVTVEGFRGIPKKIDLSFDRPVTLLLAENHQGKSSILNSVEWCLFGDECAGAGSGIRERIGWEIVSRVRESAQVQVRLVDGDRSWLVDRSQKRTGKKNHSLTLTRPDGTQVSGETASQELASLIKVNYRDFFCTAYQHQESLRGVLTQEPRERNDAIDRLLGLSQYRNLLDALRQAKVADAQKQMLGGLEVLQAKVQTALSTRRKDLDEKKTEGTKYNLTNNDYTERQALVRTDALAGDLRVVANEMNLPEPAFETIMAWSQVKSFCAAAEVAVASLLRQAPETKVQQDLLASRDRMVRAKVTVEGELQAKEAIERKIQIFAETAGTQTTIETQIASVKERGRELDKKIRATTPKAKLVEEGIALLEASGLGSGKELCPLCGHEVEDLLAHLRAEWKDQLERQIADLRAVRKQHQDELQTWEAKLEQVGRLNHERKAADSKLLEALETASVVLDKRLKASDDPIVLCNQKIKDIDLALHKTGAALGARQERLDQVSGRIRELMTVYDVIALQTRIYALDEICDCQEFKDAELLRDEMAMLVADVDAIQTAIRDACAHEANLKISTAQAAVQKYFTAMAANPAVQKVELRVEQKMNGNDYRVLDGEGKEVTPILSQGDLNCLALALFFGLAEARGENDGLSLMMLDDPSQSLGEKHMQRLIDVLNQITRVKPAILATMDPAFSKMLGQDLLKAKAIHELRDWTPQQGPKISRLGALSGAAA